MKPVCEELQRKAHRNRDLSEKGHALVNHRLCRDTPLPGSSFLRNYRLFCEVPMRRDKISEFNPGAPAHGTLCSPLSLKKPVEGSFLPGEFQQAAGKSCLSLETEEGMKIRWNDQWPKDQRLHSIRSGRLQNCCNRLFGKKEHFTATISSLFFRAAQTSGLSPMPILLFILASVVTTLILLILNGGRSRQFEERSPNIPASLSFLTEPNRPPLPHEWKHKYVPIAQTTLATQNGKMWVRHREDVPLLSPYSDSSPRDLRQQRIILN